MNYSFDDLIFDLQSDKIFLFNTGSISLNASGVQRLTNAFKANKSLRKIGITIKSLSASEFVSLLDALRTHPNLTTLTIRDGVISSEIATAIANLLRDNSHFDELNFDSVTFSTTTLQTIVNAAKNASQLRTFQTAVSNIKDSDIKYIADGLSGHSNLETLVLIKSQIGSSGFTALENFVKNTPRIQILELGYCAADNPTAANALASIIRVSRLQYLGLISTSISSTEIKVIAPALATTNQLEKLALANCPLSDSGVSSLANELLTNRGLKELILSNTAMSQNGIAALTNVLKQKPDLEVISINKNTNVGGTAFEGFADAVAKHPNLRSLTASSCLLTSSDTLQLATAVQDNQALRQISLNNNRIDNTGFSAFAAAIGKSMLRVFDFGGNSWSESKLQELATHIQADDGLTELDLTNAGITDAACTHIASILEKSNTITLLILGNNKITNDGAIKIAMAVKKNPTLVTLLINDNPIGESGIIALTEMFQHNRNLQSIYLQNIQITAEAAEKILVSITNNYAASKVIMTDVSLARQSTVDSIVRITIRNHQLVHAAYYAAASGDIDTLGRLFALGISPNGYYFPAAGDTDLNTLMHIAVLNNQVEVVKFLRAQNVAVDRANADGKTPLELAQEANSPNSDLIDALLKTVVASTTQINNPVGVGTFSMLDSPQSTFFLSSGHASMQSGSQANMLPNSMVQINATMSSSTDNSLALGLGITSALLFIFYLVSLLVLYVRKRASMNDNEEPQGYSHYQQSIPDPSKIDPLAGYAIGQKGQQIIEEGNALFNAYPDNPANYAMVVRSQNLGNIGGQPVTDIHQGYDAGLSAPTHSGNQGGQEGEYDNIDTILSSSKPGF